MSDVIYIRVSSVSQNTARQEYLQDLLPEAKSFTDKVSGKDTKRPELEALLKYVREGDTIHVHSIDRFARNVVDLRSLVTSLNAQGVSIKFHKEGLVFNANANDAMSQLMLTMLGAIGEFERELIKERQREGIELAKKEGKYKGRRKTYSIEAVREALSQTEGNKTKAAAILGCPVQTVRRVLREAQGEARS